MNPLTDLNKNIENDISPIQSLYIAELENIKKRSIPENYDKCYLERILNIDYYSWYKAEYDKFHIQYPELKDWIGINSYELMEESRLEKLLFYLKVNGEKVGLIAGEKRKIFGFNAIYINEIMIASEYKGKKYSAILLRKFIEIIPTENNYIWSHIDSRNLPSIKTALKSGQKPISVEYFIPI